MEKWQLGAVGALVCGFALFGLIARQSNPAPFPTPAPGKTLFTPPPPSPYDGKPLPPWPSIKQWINTPAPPSPASLKGHPALVEVFRTGCSHCQEAAPFLAQLHARYAPRGVNFVAIESPGNYKDPQNPENNWSQVQTWTKERGYNWPVGFDENSKWFQGTFGKNIFYPSLWVLDAQGNVVAYQSGHDTTKALRLAAMLEKVAPGSGNSQSRAKDLIGWLLKVLNTPVDPGTQSALENAVAGYVGKP